MKVLKHGDLKYQYIKTYKLICEKCDCEYLFNNRDLKYKFDEQNYSKIDYSKTFIYCPDCNNETEVDLELLSPINEWVN